MRITGGELRGRKLQTPRQGVRPTQERVREALFSSLAGRIPEARVLDLYAGTGAIGLEAWSRGAVSVDWVEQDRRTFRILQDNVRNLCGDEPAGRDCHCSEALSFLQRLTTARAEPLDLIFADPPYEPRGGGDRLEKTLQVLSRRPILKPHGLLVYEQSRKEPVAEAAGWVIWKDKVYGSTRIVMYQPAETADCEERT